VMSVNSVASRARMRAATRRIAASSVAPVLESSVGVRLKSDPHAVSQRSLRPCAARVSRPAATIYSGGDR